MSFEVCPDYFLDEKLVKFNHQLSGMPGYENGIRLAFALGSYPEAISTEQPIAVLDANLAAIPLEALENPDEVKVAIDFLAAAWRHKKYLKEWPSLQEVLKIDPEKLEINDCGSETKE